MADRDKTAREAEAIHDKIAEEVAELLAEQPIEATIDNTVDPYIELVDQEVVTEPFIENLEDPEGAKSRKSIINSIIERRAKKPNYTFGWRRRT